MKKQKLLFMFFPAALLLCWSVALASVGTVSLPATGQTKCYDTAGTEIACAGTGQDGDKRTGVMWPNPRFTVSGNCVTDNLTGLIWTKNADLPNGTKTWQQALDYVASLNTSAGGGLCGHTDWRLPQVLELESLLNEGYSGSNADWLNTQGIKNAQSGHYWSSTTYAYGAGFAWYVSFYDYSVGGNDKASSFHVWPVCGGQLSSAPSEVWKTGQTKCYQGVSPYAEIVCAGTGQDGDKRTGVAWPNPRFTDNSNGTITDNLTSLIWLKNADCFNTKSWQDALNVTNALATSQCGLSDGTQAGDWRLPNRKELLSLVDYSNFYPALPTGYPFTSAQSGFYWSSSALAYGPWNALGVDMYVGLVSFVNKPNSFYVWPVRGGYSCAATLSDSFLLHEPYFTINGVSLWLDLQYAQNTQFPPTDIMFQLSNAGGLTNPADYSSCKASVLWVIGSNYVLHIPILIFGGTSYWLDLTYVPTSDGLLWVKLTGIGGN